MPAAMRLLSWLVGLPVVVYLAVLGYLFIFQRQLLYVPDRQRPFLAGLPQLGVREIELRTADGLTLSSWYLAPRPDQPAIAYFHGNGGNIGYRADRLMRFAREGYGVLLLEYRGYGGNPGGPSEAGLYADAEAAMVFLRRQGFGPERLVLYGESLGSAVAVQIAATQPVAALVLESPFTSIADVAQYHYPFVPVRLLVRDRFDARSRIDAVRVPILVLLGSEDPVVPPRFSDALFEAAPEPRERWVAPSTGHGDLGFFGALDAVVAFIERHRR